MPCFSLSLPSWILAFGLSLPSLSPIGTGVRLGSGGISLVVGSDSLLVSSSILTSYILILSSPATSSPLELPG